MKPPWPALLIMAAGCFLASCGGERGEDSTAAIQRAIEEHLSGRPGLASDKLVLEVKDIQIQGNRAEAEVVFRSTTDPSAMMTFHYELRNEGNQWKVETGRPGERGSTHPLSPLSSDAESSLPEGHPPAETAPPTPPQ